MSTAPPDIDATLFALSQLPAGDRTMLALVYFYGHTQAEVATQLGLSRSEVGRRVSHGLHDLGNRLRGTGEPTRRADPSWWGRPR